MVKMLRCCATGADLEIKNEAYGYTALTVCAREGYIDIVSILLAAG